MILLSSLVAAAVILGQGFAVWGFLRFVKNFGAYTEAQEKFTRALLLTHESNLIVHQQNLKVLVELQRIHTSKQAVA